MSLVTKLHLNRHQYTYVLSYPAYLVVVIDSHHHRVKGRDST